MKKLLSILATLAMMIAPAFGAIVQDPTTGRGANVDSTGNLYTTMTQTPGSAGYSKITGPEGYPFSDTRDGYMKASIEDLQFIDMTEGAAVNTSLWNQSASTMTITAANGFLNLNPTNSTTASAYAILSSVQSFSLAHCEPIHIHLNMQSSLMNLPVNTVIEVGWGSAATTATPTDGVFWRVRSGSMYSVMNFGSSETETQVSPSPYPLPNPNQTYEVVLDIYADKANFYVNGTLFSELAMPTVNPSITSSPRLPVFFRVYNAGSSPASSPTLKIGQVTVSSRNSQLNRMFPEIMAGMGRGSWQSPISTFAQTTSWANSPTISNSSLANATPSFAATILGGKFAFAAVGGAVTDFPIFAYQVPTGYQLVITDSTISCLSTGAVGSTGPTAIEWGVGLNGSAGSLATADGAGTWAPRRIPIGAMSSAVSAPIGSALSPAINMNSMKTPWVIDGGRFFDLIMTVPVGVATGSQVFRCSAMFDGYFR